MTNKNQSNDYWRDKYIKALEKRIETLEELIELTEQPIPQQKAKSERDKGFCPMCPYSGSCGMDKCSAYFKLWYCERFKSWDERMYGQRVEFTDYILEPLHPGQLN